MNYSGNKKRIGIITFHRAINYGAVLQAYALQKAYQNMNCESNIIDYRNSFLENRHKKIRLSDCRNLKDFGRFVFYSNYHNRKFKLFRNFLSTHISLAHVCSSTKELQSITKKYDRIICGSDQVWNYKITNFDKNYFLDFCNDPVKKNSYAASFGFDTLPKEFIEEYKKLLNKFSNISVRERQGGEIVKELIQKDVEVVLDPTMLIPKSDWETLSLDYKNTNYILFYYFGVLTLKMKKFLKKLSDQTGCEIVYISYSIRSQLKATYEKCVGPLEFLGLFKNARYVVTNSFHGTAFSILFNKDFFLEMLPESQCVNSRLENILNVFDLKKRQIINGNNEYMDEPIDYNKVSLILQIERQKALEYLKRTIDS